MTNKRLKIFLKEEYYWKRKIKEERMGERKQKKIEDNIFDLIMFV